MTQERVGDTVIPELVRRNAKANEALINGDARRYAALVPHADDYTLMAPFGGTPTRGFDTSSEGLARLSRFFKSGTSTVEVVPTYASADMAVLVTIERQRCEVGGMPEQDWSLRVTEVYRRDGTEWRLVHRHADPLVQGISLEKAATLARSRPGAGGG